jgi:hypothetical protein
MPPGLPPVPGIADLQGTTEGATERVAVNIDPRESDAARVDPAAFQDAIARLPPADASQAQPVAARQQEEGQQLWRFAILLMAGALVAESLLSAKTA